MATDARLPFRRVLSCLIVLAFIALAVVGAQGVLAQGGAPTTAGAIAIGDVPNPPTNVVARALSTTQIQVTWTDNSNNEDHFVVYVGTTVMAVLDPNVTTYTDNSLAPGAFRCYRVEAYNAYGSSPSPSDGCTSTPHDGLPTGPAAPSQLRAAATSTTQLRLTWADNSSNEDGFKVYEDGSSADPTLVGANVTTLTVSGLAPNSTHCYHVTAYNTQGESAPSGSDCAQTTLTPPPGTPPVPPTGMTATGISQSEIKLTWLDNSTDEQGFRVYENNTLVTTVGANVTTSTIPGLAASSGHCYQVAAYNGYGETVAAGMACASTQPAPPPGPSAPTNLQATALSTSQIKLTWTDTSNNETGFKVFEGATQVIIVGANVTTYTVSGLAAGSNHCYVVYAYNGNGSSPSGQACATTQSGSASKAPSAPTNLQAAALSASQIKLTWTDTSGNESGFKIFEGTRQVGSAGAGATTVTIGGLAGNSTHCYQVASYNSYGTSAYSVAACATTLPSSTGSRPASPTSVSASGISTTRIRITWTDASTNETGFKVYEGTSLLGTVGAGVKTFTTGGMTAATYHCFQVVAYNSAGDSAPSAQACSMTASWPDDLIVTQPLTLSSTSVGRNQTVTARFTVKNNGQVDMVVADLAAAVRLGADWTGANYDFPHVTNLTLHPGQEYAYQQSRSFTVAGSYFAEQTANLPSGGGIYPTNRVTFKVN